MLSQTAEYALRTVPCSWVAGDDGARAPKKSPAGSACCATISRRLCTGWLRKACSDPPPGKGGGFRLAVPPDELKLLRVGRRSTPSRESGGRRLGRPQCSDRNPCPAHHQWRAVGERVTAFFRDRTVGDLLRGAQAAPTASALVQPNELWIAAGHGLDEPDGRALRGPGPAARGRI